MLGGLMNRRERVLFEAEPILNIVAEPAAVLAELLVLSSDLIKVMLPCKKVPKPVFADVLFRVQRMGSSNARVADFRSRRRGGCLAKAKPGGYRIKPNEPYQE